MMAVAYSEPRRGKVLFSKLQIHIHQCLSYVLALLQCKLLRFILEIEITQHLLRA